MLGSSVVVCCVVFIRQEGYLTSESGASRVFLALLGFFDKQINMNYSNYKISDSMLKSFRRMMGRDPSEQELLAFQAQSDPAAQARKAAQRDAAFESRMKTFSDAYNQYRGQMR